MRKLTKRPNQWSKRSKEEGYLREISENLNLGYCKEKGYVKLLT